MKVWLVSTWNIACGIAEHSAMAKDAIEAADKTIAIRPVSELLDPDADVKGAKPDLLWLNYQAALHSRWTPLQIQKWQLAGIPVLVTYHDTGVPNSDQCKTICNAASWFVVHEPYTDLAEHGEYIRQGIPPPEDPILFDFHRSANREIWKGRPIVGTVGFPFPWKNYDLLCQAAHLAGWGVLLIAPNATAQQVRGWQELNPWIEVISQFKPRRDVVSLLSGCDATAFLYNCANTGTSGAIRQGIAARKPVLAFAPTICRQFRDLMKESAINWLHHGSPEHVAADLRALPNVDLDYYVVDLAERDSWAHVGKRYAAIMKRLCSN